MTDIARCPKCGSVRVSTSKHYSRGRWFCSGGLFSPDHKGEHLDVWHSCLTCDWSELVAEKVLS